MSEIATTRHQTPGDLQRPSDAPSPAQYLGRMLSDRPALRIGTRTSPMAMAQARTVQRLLDERAGVASEIVGISTTGDQWMGDLSKLGGKGAFLKQIERALVMGHVDIAVHAMKDVPGDVPLAEGTVFAGYLPREDVHDVLVAREGSKYRSLDEMPPGTRIGTSAVRRKAQLLKHRPDLHVDRLRGNVNSRIAKLDERGEFEAIVLNASGLARTGLEHRGTEILPTDIMCPPVGSGVVGIQCRTADSGIAEAVRLLDDAETRTLIRAERTMLHGLQGHCNSPIAGHATMTGDGQVSLHGMVFSREGGRFVYAQEWDAPDRAAELGAYVSAVLLRKGARGIIDGIPH